MDKQVLVLADDLTGAFEVGALFAARGLPALVVTEKEMVLEEMQGGTPVLVVDTETRHLSPEDAFSIVHTIVHAARVRGVRYVYKKTDSTLRGNISSELGAVAAVFPDSPLIYSPAYPQMGRTVLDGRLYVNGIPVSATAFSIDSLNPVLESHVPTLLKSSGSGIASRSIRTDALKSPLPPGIYVLDGTLEEDLQSTAQFVAASRPPCLAAGPAGFARYLADLVQTARSVPPPMPRPASCLVINGSRNDMSAAQIRHAERLGWPTVAPGAFPDIQTGSGWFLMQNPLIPALSGAEFVRRIGEMVHRILRQASFDAMVVFGGDTAHGIVKAIGVSRIWPVGEALPGVPVSRFDPAELRGIRGPREGCFHLITKAGGFGAPDILPRIHEQLSMR